MKKVEHLCDVCGKPLMQFKWSSFISARLVKWHNTEVSLGIEMCENCWGAFRRWARTHGR